MHTYKDIDNYAVKQKSPAKPITYKKDAARMPRPFKIAPKKVVLPGFEPGQAEPKTAVLPLHHKTILTSETHRPKSDAKIDGFCHLCKCNAEKIRKTEFKLHLNEFCFGFTHSAFIISDKNFHYRQHTSKFIMSIKMGKPQDCQTTRAI